MTKTGGNINCQQWLIERLDARDPVVIKPETFVIAKLVHPAYESLSEAMRKLMARSTYLVLGYDLRTPVDFVVCWTPDGAEREAERSVATGGTGQAIALASRLGIPVFNLYRSDALKRLGAFLCS